MNRLVIFVAAAVLLASCASAPADDPATAADGPRAELVIENLTDYPIVRAIVDQANGEQARIDDEISPGDRESLDVAAGPADLELVFDVNGQDVVVRRPLNLSPDSLANTVRIDRETLATAMARAGIEQDRESSAASSTSGSASASASASASDNEGSDPADRIGSGDQDDGETVGAATREEETDSRLESLPHLSFTDAAAIARDDLPDHVRVFEAFEQFGLEFTNVPSNLEDYLVELGLASDQDLEFVAAVTPQDGGPTEIMSISESPGEWDFTHTFPQDGQYEISIVARQRGTDDEYQPVAALEVESRFPPDHQAIRYGEEDNWLRIVIRDIREINRPWEASDGEYEQYSTGVVAGDYTIVNPVAQVVVEDGAVVEFPRTDDGLIEIIGVELAEPLEVTTETADFTFVAGSTVILSESWVRGAIQHRFSQRVGGSTVTFPEGSFVEISDGRLSGVSSPERILLRYGTRLIPFNQASFADIAAGEVLRGRFVVAEARIILVNDTRIDLPEGAVVVTDNAGIAQIYADEPFPVYRASTAITVNPGQAAFFDTAGGFDGVRER